MARGTKVDYDVDALNRMVWIVEFLEDEWDHNSTVGSLPFRYREDAMDAGRKWLLGQVNDINDLAEVDTAA
jgi:hypothetical protein